MAERVIWGDGAPLSPQAQLVAQWALAAAADLPEASPPASLEEQNLTEEMARRLNQELRQQGDQ